VSLKGDIEKLTETIRGMEKLLVRGTLPDYPVIRQRVNGSHDEERFVRDYGCTIGEARQRGAVAFIVLTNFHSPTVEVSPLPALLVRVDRPAVIADDDGLVIAEPAPKPVSGQVEGDPLVETLLRQARDMARFDEEMQARSAGK
jgi:hypothetical protein